MNKSALFILIELALIVSFVFYMVGDTKSHEKLHQKIYRSYNISSYIEYHWLNTDGVIARTIPIDNFENCRESCVLAHQIVDAVDYPITMVVTFFTTFGMMVCIILFFYYQHLKGGGE